MDKEITIDKETREMFNAVLRKIDKLSEQLNEPDNSFLF